jgi:NAD(P)-dependent dehydrogenase (short-subunit alcohol dehydrogenase family)
MLCSNQLSYVAKKGCLGPEIRKRRAFSRICGVKSRWASPQLPCSLRRRATIQIATILPLNPRPGFHTQGKIILKTLLFTVFVSFYLLFGATASAKEGLIAVVTGANRGIGLEFATQLKALGYTVIATARKPAEAAALNALEVQVEQLDVTDSASVKAFADRLAGKGVDLLINNAGYGGQRAPGFKETDFDTMAFAFDVNSLGPMRVTQALLDNLEAGKGKKVIQISSTMASITNNWGGGYGYRASKTALNMLNSTLALELGKTGLIAVVMHPGWVKTRMGGAGAQIDTTQSVSGMLSVIEGLEASDNGRFLDYRGKELPW